MGGDDEKKKKDDAEEKKKEEKAEDGKEDGAKDEDKVIGVLFILLNYWSWLLSKADLTSEYLLHEHFQVKRPLIKYYLAPILKMSFF